MNTKAGIGTLRRNGPNSANLRHSKTVHIIGELSKKGSKKLRMENMKSVIILIISIFVFGVCSLDVKADQMSGIAYTQASLSNLRKDREGDAEIVLKLPINTKVDILDKLDGWFFVQVPGRESGRGWLHQSLVSKKPLSIKVALDRYESSPETSQERLKWIERASALDPQNMDVLNQLIKTLRSLGEHDRADLVFNNITETKRKTESIETSVYVEAIGRSFALPVFSFPLVASQISFNNRYEMENRMSLPKQNFVKKIVIGGDDLELMVYSPSDIYQHHHMRSHPMTWFDSSGRAYDVERGLHFDDMGGLTGVEIIGRAAKGAAEHPILLVNKKSALPHKRKLPRHEWKQWPEIRTELNEWASDIIHKCGASKGLCKKNIEYLTDLKNLNGEAIEYTFSNNERLQILIAKSSVDGEGVINSIVVPDDLLELGIGQDILKVKMWRLIDSSGHIRILNDANNWASGIRLEDHYCESQCSGEMNDIEIISLGGRIYSFASYWIGTVSGYIFFEIDASGFREIGWYRWGS